MTTLQEAAMRKALELGKKYAKCLMMNQAPFDEALAALAQQGEPVCAGCGIPVGDVHMSTCKSGKWPSRVSNGDTAAPAPQPAQRGVNGSLPDEWPAEFCTWYQNLPDFKPEQLWPIWNAHALQSAQPVAQQDHIPDAGKMVLSDDEILTIAHRKATRYTHAVAPGQVTYGFTVTHLLDFARAVEVAHGIKESKNE